MLPALFTDVRWRPVDEATGIPTSLRATIRDQDSLTRRLKQQHNNAFFVRLLSQDWQVPAASERRFLRCQDEQASVREVLLFGSGRPVVFARSVLPLSSLSGQNSELLNLGETPLGEYIFKQSGLSRGPIEVAPIKARALNDLTGFDYGTDIAWARRSLFHVRAKPILVCEVFLPERAGHCATMSAPTKVPSDTTQKNLCQQA